MFDKVEPAQIQTCPSLTKLQFIANRIPEAMRPSVIPHAVILEGALPHDICDMLVYNIGQEEPYDLHGCNAITREAPKKKRVVEMIKYVVGSTKLVNSAFFNFTLDPEPLSWMQTYMVGHDYQLHMDASPGSTRKLTSVVMLTDPSEYEGGTLVLRPHPERYEVPKTKGTIVTFPSWIYHEVTPVEKGCRRSLNVGFYGPPFK